MAVEAGVTAGTSSGVLGAGGGRSGANDHSRSVSPPDRASTALSKALKARGIRFVGPTTAYALMQAVGLVDDHLAGCWVVSDR